MSETLLELKNIKKSFGTTDVLNGIRLSISRGEFITFLGASGCGKTTTLRIIAGLEKPDEGQVLLEGKDVTDLEPHQRDVNTVFQNYALFPHMNVEANVGYGLKIRKVPKSEIRHRVTDMLKLVQLDGYEKRMPSEDFTYTLALLFPIPKIMESGPLALFISFLDIYCPIPTKTRIGRTQEIRIESTGETCSTISPENFAPESYSLWVSSGSSIIPVL